MREPLCGNTQVPVCWQAAQAMPLCETRTKLELEHQGVEQLTLNLRRTLMEML